MSEMNNDIRCTSCPMMEIRSSEFHPNQRKRCFCIHPDAQDVYRLIPNPKPPSCFIDFIWTGLNAPKVKGAPHWCPKKVLVRPLEISRKDAYRIISSRKPNGLFWLKEQDGYVGIDNLTGDAWVEEFDDPAVCRKWLLGAELGGDRN